MSQETEELTLDDAFSDEVAEPEVITKTIETDAVKAEEPEVVEESVKTEPETKPEESTTDSKQESWTFSQAMDEREKRQKEKKRADDLQLRLDALEKPADEVSVLDDEEAWQENQDQKSDQKLANAMLAMSRAYAVRELGEDTVAETEKWYADEGMKSPYVSSLVDGAELKFHKAHDLMLEDKARQDPETFKAKYEAEVLEKLKAEGWTPPQETETDPPSITPSLASSRSTGSKSEPPEDYEDILGE